MADYDAVLFDFDGVLMDTEPLHYACWMEALREFRVEVTLEQYLDRWVGVADSLMLDDMGRLANPPVYGATLARFHPAKRELFSRRSLTELPWTPEVAEFLSSLEAYKLAVVTSSDRSEVAPLLEAGGIRRFFQAEVYGNETSRLKPAPDPYLRAAEVLGARRPLVVEDSDDGVASARAAGFDFVRVRTPREVAAAVRERLGSSFR
jgi:beta-phosphoglucomutase